MCSACVWYTVCMCIIMFNARGKSYREMRERGSYGEPSVFLDLSL